MGEFVARLNPFRNLDENARIYLVVIAGLIWIFFLIWMILIIRINNLPKRPSQDYKVVIQRAHNRAISLASGSSDASQVPVPEAQPQEAYAANTAINQILGIALTAVTPDIDWLAGESINQIHPSILQAARETFQNNGYPYGNPYNMCGEAAITLAMNYVNHNLGIHESLDAEEIIHLVGDNRWFSSYDGLLDFDGLSYIAARYGLSTYSENGAGIMTEEQVLEFLRLGYPVIPLTRYTYNANKDYYMTSAAPLDHFITLVGYDEETDTILMMNSHPSFRLNGHGDVQVERISRSFFMDAWKFDEERGYAVGVYK